MPSLEGFVKSEFDLRDSKARYSRDLTECLHLPDNDHKHDEYHHGKHVLLPTA